MCGAKGLATPSLAEVSPFNNRFRAVYGRTKRLWTGWKRFNQTHFYNKETIFQVPFNDSCYSYLEKSIPFAFDFVPTVLISLFQGNYVTVSKTDLCS